MPAQPLLGRDRASVRVVPAVVLLFAMAGLVLVANMLPARPAALFQNPDQRGSSALDPDSWTIEGILDDGIDGDTGGERCALSSAAPDWSSVCEILKAGFTNGREAS